ncbi:hypothetical protein [Sporosalibacterium faouarense]|uniref:hypothetical protein n=1 Tax=Sporosalibacterium faouarense TaxID=516123 RepID=UPI00141C26EB|nr:hypothetical protein [Sporosalibacterium faouarense]MTI47497.1 hypothetical protein [Bacillota bacterium]
MDKKCTFYQNRLIDIFYEEDIMDKEIQEHIINCHECNKYWKELKEVKIKVDKDNEEIPIEYIKISQAFDKVEDIKSKRLNIINLVIFIMISSVLLGIGLVFAMQGFGREIIYFQVIVHTVFPIFLLIFVKIRTLKEDYNG